MHSLSFGRKEIGNHAGVVPRCGTGSEGRVQTYRENLQSASKPDFSFPFLHSREVLLLILYLAFSCYQCCTVMGE